MDDHALVNILFASLFFVCVFSFSIFLVFSARVAYMCWILTFHIDHECIIGLIPKQTVTDTHKELGN